MDSNRLYAKQNKNYLVTRYGNRYLVIKDCVVENSFDKASEANDYCKSKGYSENEYYILNLTNENVASAIDNINVPAGGSPNLGKIFIGYIAMSIIVALIAGNNAITYILLGIFSAIFLTILVIKIVYLFYKVNQQDEVINKLLGMLKQKNENK